MKIEKRKRKNSVESAITPRDMARYIKENAYPNGRLVAYDYNDRVQVYFVSNNNVVSIVNRLEREKKIFELFPNQKSRARSEVDQALLLLLSLEAPFAIDNVAHVAFEDEIEVMTWNRLPFKKAELPSINLEKDIPEFKHFIDHCDDPLALVLWIGSLFDLKSGRQQTLHLHGGGGNGKSVLQAAIESVLGSRAVVRTKADALNSAHFGANLESARLLLFPDENAAGFMSRSSFKVLSEPFLSVNPKFENPKRITAGFKIWITSNSEVEITVSKADQRRLLSISMKEDKNANYRQEWWYNGLLTKGQLIVAYCISEYEKACAHDSSIRSAVPSNTNSTELAISRRYENITQAILANYTLTKENNRDLVRVADLHRTLAAYVGERVGNRTFIAQVREALGRLNVGTHTKSGGILVYTGIKASPTMIDYGNDSKVILFNGAGVI
jgi:hypothetical protein